MPNKSLIFKILFKKKILKTHYGTIFYIEVSKYVQRILRDGVRFFEIVKCILNFLKS